MPRLPVIEVEQANEKVQPLYDLAKKKLGRVVNLLKGMANSPVALDAYLQFAGTLKAGALNAKEREIVHLTTDVLNHCEYCVAAHSAAAKAVGFTPDQVAGIRNGQLDDPKQQVLADFTRRVVESKGYVGDEELAAMRDAGYSDAQITEVPAVIALATFTNLFNHIHQTPLDFPKVEPAHA
ncbi:MAG: carboxymuconolactone decarboxylase family protein [Planctomycetes bacterium]|nr:carboxymuconolactone decarboxylase family protein [Planctomycetota bacterium]